MKENNQQKKPGASKPLITRIDEALGGPPTPATGGGGGTFGDIAGDVVSALSVVPGAEFDPQEFPLEEAKGIPLSEVTSLLDSLRQGDTTRVVELWSAAPAGSTPKRNLALTGILLMALGYVFSVPDEALVRLPGEVEVDDDRRLAAEAKLDAALKGIVAPWAGVRPEEADELSSVLTGAIYD